MNAAKRIDALCAAAVAVIFLALHLPGAHSHAIHPDEADMLYPMLGLLRQNAVLLHRCVAFHLGSFSFPVMIHPYHGPYEGYLSLPFLALLGNTSEAVFLRSAFYDAVSTALIFWAAKSIFRDRLAAFLAGFLWATSGFALSSDIGLFWGTSVIGIVMLALIAAVDWLETARPAALIAASAWLGLACAARAWVIALPLACLAAAPLARREILRALGRMSRRELAAAAGVFLLFFIPNLIGNALTGFRLLRASLSGSAAAPVPLRTAAAIVGDGLWGLLTGQYDRFVLIGNDHGPGVVLTSKAGFGVLFAAALALTESLRRKIFGGAVPRRHLLILAVFSVFTLLAVLSPTNKNANHLYPVLPFLYMNLAALPLIFSSPRVRNAAWAAVIAFAAYSALQNYRNIRWYQNAARAKGGSGPESSDAILELSSWLTRENIRNPVAASAVNISGNLLYFGGGELAPEDIVWGPDPAAPFERGRWEGLVCSADRTFIVNFDPFPERDTAPALTAIARGCGKSLVRIRNFLSRDGRVVYTAYRTRR